MRSVHTVAEVRSAEEALLARTPDGELMQRAATGLARTCAALLTQSGNAVYGSRVVVLVGGGNNGGDALFAGAMLARRGAQVIAIEAAESTHSSGRTALTRAHGRLLSGTDLDVPGVVANADLIVDGLVGIGGRGGLTGVFADLAIAATEGGAIVVAVDVPSGINPDTGEVSGEAMWADVTVTFGALKPGLLIGPAADHVGLVELVDIGLAEELPLPSMTMLEAVDVAGLQPHPLPSDHKYSQGVVGVAAGSARYPGAAVLCVGAATHTKAGLVRYIGDAAEAVVTAWPSAVVSTSRPRDVERVQAWVVGPGLGLGADAVIATHDVMQQPLPVVVDADALTQLADDPALATERRAWTVVTPHDGEFARLAPELELSRDRITAARALADRWGVTVLLKGSTTVIADPDGTVRLNPTGTPWLATAGTGDVLAGMIGAYLAAGLTPLDAASVAAFVHGLAGRLAAAGAPCSSRDVVDAIPAAIRAVTE